MTVQMIKIPALAGRTVKIMGTLNGRHGVVPIVFRVDTVEDAGHPSNVGRVWWLWGERVYASPRRMDEPTKVQATAAQFIHPDDVLAILR